jgi:hypothetical protein
MTMKNTQGHRQPLIHQRVAWEREMDHRLVNSRELTLVVDHCGSRLSEAKSESDFMLTRSVSMSIG